MDETWVNLPRPTSGYTEGIRNFVKTTKEKLGNPPKIRCPCTKCRNLTHQTSEDVVWHLIWYGMDEIYNVEFIHGKECFSSSFYARLENETTSPMPSSIRREDVWIKAHTKKNGEVPTAFVGDCVSKIEEFKSSQTSSEAPPIEKDALSHTFGPERNGRVKAMGPGITPSQVGLSMNNSKKVQILEHNVSDLTHQLGDLQNLMYKFLKQKGDANINTSSPRSQNIVSRVNGDDQNIPSLQVNEIHKSLSPRSSNGSSKIGGRTHSGTKCKLLNWQGVVVAEATIASTDPNDLVHHIPVGKDCWKVWVKVSLDDEAPLFKPNSLMSVMGDAQGSTIAWHKDFITLDES